MVDVTVVVGTFGHLDWVRLAERRAIPSAESHGVPVVHSHGMTLDDARNHGLSLVRTEYVCHLDADDELEPNFFGHMDSSDADLRAPSVRYVRNGRWKRPIMPKVAGHDHDCDAHCLRFGNWLVVGTVARTSLLVDVGGWRDFPWSEDWDLWLRCYLKGATIEPVPKAVYRAHVRTDSRNRAPSRAERLAAHRAIAEANGVPVP